MDLENGELDGYLESLFAYEEIQFLCRIIALESGDILATGLDYALQDLAEAPGSVYLIGKNCETNIP